MKYLDIWWQRIQPVHALDHLTLVFYPVIMEAIPLIRTIEYSNHHNYAYFAGCLDFDVSKDESVE